MNLPPVPALLALNAVALAGLTFLWVDQGGQIKNIHWSAPVPLKAAISLPPDLPRTNTDPSVFAGVLERPLFAPDRRPVPKADAAAVQPMADALDDAHLVGLLSGETGGVLIRVNDKVQHVGLKKMLGGWTLQSVEDRIATFTKAELSKQLTLEYTRLGQTSTVSPVTTAATQAKAPAVPVGVNAENYKRQMSEEEDRNRRVEELRARMAQKKP